MKKPKNAMIRVRIEQSIAKTIEKAAEAEGLTLSEWTRQVLRAAVGLPNIWQSKK